ncbi:unnamed protein product [Brachionus calyciflorus]|uniref:Uncharacterized protein n=1 Tax=Brachionus calyciflorus TaxID=104777 RepID=A0A814PSV6_9BILA|nr:unnamed protein product [Brachionus calyciflorus]
MSQFQASVTKWSVAQTTTTTTGTVGSNETDYHFNCHLETIKNDLNEIEEVNKIAQNLIDEKEEDTQVDDEPKVFQDEEILDEISNEPVVWLKKTEFKKTNNNGSKLTSTMPTPMAYSRSSSLTSLNSFDVKSIHSTVESEYSHAPNNKDASIIDDDDIDGLLPDSPAAPDSSFLKAQRTIHKINQAECRQNAWKISNDLNSFMSKLTVSETIKPEPNTPPVKLVQVPKFLQSNPSHIIQAPPQPVMSVTYGFLKNTNQPPPPVLTQPKFLLSAQTYPIHCDDIPKVYSSIKLKPDSPQESICSRMSDASLPSLIRQDIGSSNQKFNKVLNQNPNFKALFEKLAPKNENCSSSSSSGSSCSSVIPKLTEENESENEDSSFLNTTTKPMNTPAGFASVSAGASLLEDPDDNETTHNNEECLYIDFDLENFIKENFQPNSNEESSDVECKGKFSKRASLQSLDLSNNKTKVKSNVTCKKRLSEDNLKIPLKKNETLRGSRTNSASVSSTIAKTVSKTVGPVVNMTKTAQLRASKLTTTTKSTVSKPLEKKSAVINQPKLNKLSQKSDRFNTTVNENEIKLNPNTTHLSNQATRRFSIGNSSLVKKEPVKKPVLSSLNKDLNSTTINTKPSISNTNKSSKLTINSSNSSTKSFQANKLAIKTNSKVSAK